MTLCGHVFQGWPIWLHLTCRVLVSEGGYEHMSFEAQSAFLEVFIDAQELEDVHVVAPDIAMPVALHYVIHKEA